MSNKDVREASEQELTAATGGTSIMICKNNQVVKKNTLMKKHAVRNYIPSSGLICIY